jgi:hypothetical protein
LDTRKFANLAAFRTPGFLGSNGSFGFTNFNSFDQCDANGLNFTHGFRHNKSPVNLYLQNSNSPSSVNHCENGGASDNNFCYQTNNNNNHSNNNNNNIQLNNKNLDSAHKNNNYNNYSEVSSRENSPRDNYRVDSPGDKRADTCSPEETSRSYSSHKNDDIGSRSPNHNDNSIDSQSPENLSSSKSHLNNNNNKNLSASDMLDHKLQLSFLGPPLAALHSMTEMKSQQNSPQTSQNSQCVTNPHGIDSILSRPTPVTNAHLNALGGNLHTLISN